MSHNWNTGTQDTFDRFPNLSPAFQLDTIGMRLFHHPDSGGQGFFRVSLVRTERQVYHHQRTIHRFHDRFTMVNHLVERNRQSGHVSSHYVRSGVSHRDHIHSCLIDQFRHRIIIGGKHGYFLTTLLHLYQAMRGHLSIIIDFCDRHIIFLLIVSAAKVSIIIYFQDKHSRHLSLCRHVQGRTSRYRSRRYHPQHCSRERNTFPSPTSHG